MSDLVIDGADIDRERKSLTRINESQVDLDRAVISEGTHRFKHFIFWGMRFQSRA